MGSAEVQGKLWGARARDWAEVQEPLTRPLYEAALSAADVGAGTRLLDAGCGAGLALRIAADKGAAVTGFDASDGLITVARERVPEADIRQGDLELLPWDDGAFDVVTAFNSIQYCTDAKAALAELRRVVVDGGRVVVATWGQPERCETRTLLAALGSLLPPPPPGAGGPFALSAPGLLETFVDEVGLTTVAGDEVATPFVYADLDAAVHAALASGPAARAIEHSGEQAVTETVTEALRPYVTDDGTVRQENTFRYVVAS